MSTTHSTLLGTICHALSVVIFLDLEKAFELICPLAVKNLITHMGIRVASPLAIQETLINMEIRCRLWIDDYFRKRTAKVRLQGHLPQHMSLEIGMPQDGVLSPAHFNTLMSCILNKHLPEGCKITCYGDDLAIISAGRHCLRRTQSCLDLVSEKCCRTGLKISAAKYKALAL